MLCNILLFSSSCNAASGMHNNDGKSASSDYFYMVTGVGAQCESFKATTGGRIDNTRDCDYAREGTGYCKEYHNGDNHYDTNGVYRESKSSYPEGCYCKSTAPDHEYIITLNSRASGKDCDNEYCLCISRTKDYVVKGGARCENNNFIQTEEACLAIVLKKIQEFAVLKSRESHIRFLHNLICHMDVTVNQIRYTLIIIQMINQILARMQTDASAISRKEI